MNDMMAAAVKTITRPWWNGPEMTLGKNCLPVSTPTCFADRWFSAPVGPSRLWIGL